MATELRKRRVSKCPSGLSPQRRRAGRTFLPTAPHAKGGSGGGGRRGVGGREEAHVYPGTKPTLVIGSVKCYIKDD